jgi:acetylornithine deacetylase/succinyl-diaminopimelate desuccinylase-like protein
VPDRPEISARRVERTPPGELLERLRELGRRPAQRAALEFFAQEKKWIDEQQLQVCRTPAPTFREQQRADQLVGLFRGMGHLAKIDEAGNVIVPVVYGEELPFVAATAHMDTVLVPHHLSDVSIRADGTFEGPGVTDNGSGLAALLALGRVLKEHEPFPRPRRNMLLVANVAEEGEGNLHGMNYLCRHSPYAPRIEAYVVLDGASTGHITVEALGSRRFEVVIEGHGGHSWNDYGMANPVHALGRTITLLADTKLPASPRTTLNVGVIEGGAGVNSIAPIARAKIDIRSRSAAAMKSVVDALEGAVKKGVEAENRASTDRLSGYRIREIGHRPAASFNPENPLLDCFRAVDAHLGIRSRLDCASTDANVPLAMGRPAVAIGAGGRGGGAHSPTEWFHPEGREIGLQRILLGLSLLLDGSV